MKIKRFIRCLYKILFPELYKLDIYIAKAKRTNKNLKRFIRKIRD